MFMLYCFLLLFYSFLSFIFLGLLTLLSFLLIVGYIVSSYFSILFSFHFSGFLLSLLDIVGCS